MQTVIMNHEMQDASEAVAIELMVPKLREAGIDLADMGAVRDALVTARFGERLIVNCAERAAMAASKPAPAWTPWLVTARSAQEQAVFNHFGETLVDEGVDLEDEAAVLAAIDHAGFGPDMAKRIAAGAAQAAMERDHA